MSSTSQAVSLTTPYLTDVPQFQESPYQVWQMWLAQQILIREKEEHETPKMQFHKDTLTGKQD